MFIKMILFHTKLSLIKFYTNFIYNRYRKFEKTELVQNSKNVEL